MTDRSQDTVEIPRAEYEALIEARDELHDIASFDRAVANLKDGLPHVLVLRLIDGEAPLKVYREWRGLTQTALSEASGVNRVQITDIEAGRSNGSVATLRKLAQALNIAMDDIA